MQRLAHATYVLAEDESAIAMGADLPFLLSPLKHWYNPVLMISVAALVIASIVLLPRIPFVMERLRHMRGKARTYRDYIPLILRVSLGLALIGGGAEHFLLAPTIDVPSGVALAEAVIGFMLVAGFLTSIAAAAAVVLFVAGAVTHTELLGNLEFAAAGLAALLLGGGRPSVDDIFGIPNYVAPEHVKTKIALILRVGLGTTLIWLACFEKLFNPHLFAQVVEQYNLANLVAVDGGMWTLSTGIIELTIGILILLGIHTRVASVVASVVLVATFLYFGEHVAAHVTLFGTLAALFILGNGDYSLSSWYAKRKLA